MPYAHPSVEHFSPLFVALGAASDPAGAPVTTIEAEWKKRVRKTSALGRQAM